MIHRSNDAPNDCGGASHGEPVVELIERLREGVAALNDPAIEAKVRDYFERNPNYSCDVIHVAAVACAFHAAKQRAATLTQSLQTAKAVSPRI